MSDTSVDLDFSDYVSETKSVNIGGQLYVLRQPDAGAGAAYRNCIFESAALEEGKPTAFSGLADAEAILVGHCLFRIKDNGAEDDSPVGVAFVKSLPDPIVKKLFAVVKEMGRLDDTEEAVGKQ